MATGQGNNVYVPSWVYWILGGALALMLLAMLYLTVTVPRAFTFFSSPSAQTIGQILTNTDQYVGRTVTLQAPVAADLSSNAFLAGEIHGPNNGTILVIAPNGTTSPPVVGQNVVITGVVRRMDLATAQRYIPDGFDPAVVAQYSGQPAIFATSIRTVPR